ncbi:MAG: nucleoside phosphorylase [Lachnospiraceae bacterium]|nr:nucleoside phosphorylase [Lachnospiraceae bacterium]
MIHRTLDLESEPILKPESVYGKHERIADICVITFSYRVIEWAVTRLDCHKVAEIGCINGNHPIYLTTIQGVKIAFYMTLVSSSGTATCLEEANCFTGAEKFILFGSCGALDYELTKGKVIVPTQAYRDEGLSYHYQEASEYIDIVNSDKLAELLRQMQVPYVQGKIWTTDAIYRETKNKAGQLREEGCIAVEMELAGAQAVCNFHNWELYNFLLTGDSLDGEQWSAEVLGSEEEVDLQICYFQLALKAAVKLADQENAVM